MSGVNIFLSIFMFAFVQCPFKHTSHFYLKLLHISLPCIMSIFISLLKSVLLFTSQIPLMTVFTIFFMFSYPKKSWRQMFKLNFTCQFLASRDSYISLSATMQQPLTNLCVCFLDFRLKDKPCFKRGRISGTYSYISLLHY